jgi:PTS system cellobiose-specific IIC component
MSKTMDLLERTMLPLASKLSSNRYLNALRDGFMLALPLTIFGSIFVVIANLPFLPKIMSEEALSAFKTALNPAGQATLTVMTIFVILGVGYSLLNSYNKKGEIFGGVIAFSAFLILTPYGDNFISLNHLGAQSMFVGILSAFAAIEIYQRLEAKGPTIKMPDSVPPAVAKSFAALIPASGTLVLFLLIRIIFSFTPFGDAHSFIYTLLQVPLTKLGSSIVAIVISVMLIQILWFFGLHGQIIVNGVFDPITIPLGLANVAALNAGQELPNIITKSFLDTFLVGIGGSGATLPVVLGVLIFMKSKQLRTTAKLAAPAGLFNVNEPVIFGFPIVMNPMFFVPWVLAPMIITVTTYLSMKWGLVPLTTGVQVPWTTPIFIGGMIATNSVRGGILQLVNAVIVLLVWLPFLRVVDKVNCQKESEPQVEENLDLSL